MPETVISCPGLAIDGDTVKMLGAGATVNGLPALFTPPTLTTTLPLVAPAGTETTMRVGLQLAASPALVPLKVTVLVPWVAPKLAPVIVTAAPTGPEAGDKPLIPGATAGVPTVHV